ncbi:Tyrosine aminotransferase [Melia azedarach]|uniref:Tyrosine aminotransferase n=1 Tax=Melia azedarach TaxID=155640 RepID=A0ACC1Z149_MELAZ|nr:Tyrosine aminotransferase [Melia azedarach]
MVFYRPGYPLYEACAGHSHLEVRRFDLLPEKDWEVDLDAVEALADENTVALVIISPGSPCGNVFPYQYLQKIAETARKLGIMFLVGLSQDPNGILQKSGIVNSIKGYLNIPSDPATFVQHSGSATNQGTVPQILGKTNEAFFSKIVGMLREAAEICYNKIKEIPCGTCSVKPQGSMSVMVKLNISLLEDTNDDMDFSFKLATEESVVVLPGKSLGMKNWLRISIGIEPSILEDGLGRMKSFCQRHAKKR